MKTIHLAKDAITRRQSTLSYCSKIGTRLGRIMDGGAIAFDPDRRTDIALCYHMLNMANGINVLANELGLSSGLQGEIQELTASIRDFFEPYNTWNIRQTRKDRPFFNLIDNIKPKISLEVGEIFGEEHREAYRISYMLIFTALPFQLTDKNHKHLTGEPLREYLFDPQIHSALLGRFDDLLSFCASQSRPPINLSLISTYTEKFREKRLNNEELRVLRELVVIRWPEALNNHFDPISNCDARTIEERSGLTIEQLLSQSLRLGKRLGEFSAFLTGELINNEDPEFRQYSYKINILLQHFSIPVNIEEFREQIVNDIQSWRADDPKNEEKKALRREKFYYEIINKTQELLDCFYGNLISEIFMAGYYLGEAAPFLDIVLDQTPGDKHVPLVDYYTRGSSLWAVSHLERHLKKLPVSEGLRAKVTNALQIWQDPESPQHLLQEIRTFLKDALYNSILKEVLRITAKGGIMIPNDFAHLSSFLSEFFQDHPDYDRNVFVMMRFRDNQHLSDIFKAIESTLQHYGLKALRSDHRDYTGELWTNVCVYMLGCKYGIAVFEEIEEREINPNIALELGFMMATGKRCLILKDQAMPRVPSDIVGKLYKPFDTRNISRSVPKEVISWLVDLGLKGKD
jgi:hypothetical protein